jgi:hypothetical protein
VPCVCPVVRYHCLDRREPAGFREPWWFKKFDVFLSPNPIWPRRRTPSPTSSTRRSLIIALMRRQEDEPNLIYYDCPSHISAAWLICSLTITIPPESTPPPPCGVGCEPRWSRSTPSGDESRHPEATSPSQIFPPAGGWLCYCRESGRRLRHICELCTAGPSQANHLGKHRHALRDTPRNCRRPHASLRPRGLHPTQRQ